MTKVMAATATSPLLLLLLAVSAVIAESAVHRHVFTIQMMRVRRRCNAHNVATVNGEFPGPIIEIRNGDTLEVLVRNRGKYNATIHWHGVRQMRSAWFDGPEYITQCPIRPGAQYTYRFTISGQEGTLWWHAHSSWLRATVYGALIIRPAPGDPYPFTHPVSETPILLGEWWNANPIDVANNATRTAGTPNVSEAFTINGLPGDKYPSCPKNRHNDATFTLKLPAATKPQTHLLRIVNAAVNTYLFFKVAGHNLTVVGADASYTKPYTTDVLMLGPGQTTDATFIGRGGGRFYMAASAYSPAAGVPFDNTTTTAILEYGSANGTPVMPKLPTFNDTQTANTFVTSLRSLGSREHPVHVPTGKLDEILFYTVGLGLIPCSNSRKCGGPNNTRIAASINNQSFVLPQRTSVLQAHRFNVKGVFTANLPSSPPVKFDYTANNISRSLWTPIKATKVKVVKYNATVQIVLQGTNIFAGESHPIHLHGYDFYVVGIGSGNYNPKRDPVKFNLVDPPMRNTVTVPMRGWAAIRFVADNPGAWLMHCHLDGHLGWGLATVFVVPDGAGPLFSLESPPPDLPPC